jgi:DNA-binding response OmpR family regulator
MSLRRRQVRVVMSVPVEIVVGDVTISALSQDVTPHGMFVRMAQPLAIGTRVELTILPDSERLRTVATVAHTMSDAEARLLGRSPGVGLVFSDLDRGRAPNLVFTAAMTRLIDATPQAAPSPEGLHIVIADPSTRLLERLSTALGQAGFSVAIASNGMEALAACLRRAPDVVLAARDMPIIDGLHLLEELGRHSELAGVPVMIMSEQASDLIRLRAFQLGAMDFIPKPFTVLEVILRARRIARGVARDPERVVLRGALTELGLPPLLTMLDQERKNGILSITRDDQIAWISFANGRIIKVRATELDGDSLTLLMHVLDWTEGHFELAVGVQEDQPEIDLAVTHALLEHARRRDEATRAP